MTKPLAPTTIGERQAIAPCVGAVPRRQDATFDQRWCLASGRYCKFATSRQCSMIASLTAALARGETESQAPTTNAPVAAQREAVARIVAPDVWRLIDHWGSTANRPDLLQRIEEQSVPSLAKADAILALRQTLPIHGEMREALEQAATWFEEYATEHYAKALTAPDSREQHGREVKGKTNRDRAAFLRNALQGDGL